MKLKTDLVAKVVVLLLAAAPPAGAQEAGSPSADGLWTPVDASRLESRAEMRGPGDAEPSPSSPNVRLYELNDASLRQKLEQSPAEEAAPAADLDVAKTIVTLPLADGSFERFAIEETAVMAPELAAKFPELRTFRGQGVDDPSARARLPNVAGSNMRIKVESVGNVFFALSPDDFTIQPARLSVVAVRHGEAETAGGDSRALTPAGLERALSLSRLLGSSQIGKVFSTNTRRTQSTARPTADSLGLPVEPYAQPEILAQQLLAGGRQRVLVVGHSDTTPELLQALDVAAPVTIGENEFDRLFIVTVPESGPVLFEEIRYEITQE
jgi:phosphohistidine phosphatase SixA